MSNKAKKRQGEMVYNGKPSFLYPQYCANEIVKGKGKAKNTGSSNRRNNDISLLDSAIKANQDAASESPYVRVNGKIYRK